jgi:hypothetical protein
MSAPFAAAVVLVEAQTLGVMDTAAVAAVLDEDSV